MDVVSVNLSRGDAALLLRAVENELGGCDCAERSSSRCDRCEALGAIRADLEVVLGGRRARAVRHTVPAPRALALAEPAVGLDVYALDPPMVC